MPIGHEESKIMTDDRFMTAAGIVVVWPNTQRTFRFRIARLVGRLVRR
jgi:hypothetical protein